jgi:pSer/pThr/pTyr-binding forkhead associated (FHA) protein
MPAMWIATEDGSVVEIAEGVTRIGRSLLAAVRLEDPTVSRRHALIVRTGADVRLLDDRSMTGTRVNGRPVVVDQRLEPGDVIEVGRHTLTVVAGVPQADMDAGIAHGLNAG